MQIRPIRSVSDYEEALRRVEAVWGAPLGSKEGDELDVLATLIEAYEREHYPINLPSPLAAIEFRLEQSGKTYKDLIGILGQRTRVYEVMRGARPLSLRMIRNLHQHLGIPAEVLIRPERRGPKRHVRSGRSTSVRAHRPARRRA